MNTIEKILSRLLYISDICRVCRCEGAPNRPLFHPCICTGSIKFIHQECLLQWLRYSKKEFCELCTHRFSFTPSKNSITLIYIINCYSWYPKSTMVNWCRVKQTTYAEPTRQMPASVVKTHFLTKMQSHSHVLYIRACGLRPPKKLFKTFKF